ncbi:hypothetical protein LX15_000652 [Streptoalloteichus tenebrarius]|uniref:Uncharacterized protein n=1 Tax=Streptoalloteichus tenebrarius (strain ATCC 17920 / DSM 40477 / JCM 4838 / CBS 697.72 / NBRC 16177 / NCIMB 11028 / NRRL B-12390 / A12253. 1 / ISP 5477) TaxID=1933 RepID=A0ABT1HN87_STRSD|nr:hypothetical protein [Streptoalloteichus tenebrarius]MCP2256969.1 hypothetical protein [Streptoalloteichus tenebrarius]BFF00120.1 hypothetical protein GCM10020241_17950 [Streptoalloteichus tenebrarius]
MERHASAPTVEEARATLAEIDEVRVATARATATPRWYWAAVATLISSAALIQLLPPTPRIALAVVPGLATAALALTYQRQVGVKLNSWRLRRMRLPIVVLVAGCLPLMAVGAVGDHVFDAPWSWLASGALLAGWTMACATWIERRWESAVRSAT